MFQSNGDTPTIQISAPTLGSPPPAAVPTPASLTFEQPGELLVPTVNFIGADLQYLAADLYSSTFANSSQSVAQLHDNQHQQNEHKMTMADQELSLFEHLEKLFFKRAKEERSTSMHLDWSNIILALSLILLILTTIVGNLFVIVAILIERNLRTVGNYLVLSLAIADLLVACLVMPMAGLYLLLGRWTLSKLMCEIWTSADVFCCTASILHLLAIAMDRYWAVTRVDYIRCQRNERRILLMIFLVWMIACVISLAPAFGWKDAKFEYRLIYFQQCLLSQDIGYQIVATGTTFYLPLILTLILYWKIYQVARKRIRRKLNNRRVRWGQVVRAPSSCSSNNDNNNNNRRRSAGGSQVTQRTIARLIRPLDRFPCSRTTESQSASCLCECHVAPANTQTRPQPSGQSLEGPLSGRQRDSEDEPHELNIAANRVKSPLETPAPKAEAADEKSAPVGSQPVVANSTEVGRCQKRQDSTASGYCCTKSNSSCQLVNGLPSGDNCNCCSCCCEEKTINWQRDKNRRAAEDSDRDDEQHETPDAHADATTPKSTSDEDEETISSADKQLELEITIDGSGNLANKIVGLSATSQSRSEAPARAHSRLASSTTDSVATCWQKLKCPLMLKAASQRSQPNSGCNLCRCSAAAHGASRQLKSTNSEEPESPDSPGSPDETTGRDLMGTVASDVVVSMDESDQQVVELTPGKSPVVAKNQLLNTSSKHQQPTMESIESKRERKAAKTLAIITGVFVMCWLPFFMMTILMIFDYEPHRHLFSFLLWLGYFNSMLNPIIYTIFSPEFRTAFKRILCVNRSSHQIQRNLRSNGNIRLSAFNQQSSLMACLYSSFMGCCNESSALPTTSSNNGGTRKMNSIVRMLGEGTTTRLVTNQMEEARAQVQQVGQDSETVDAARPTRLSVRLRNDF